MKPLVHYKSAFLKDGWRLSHTSRNKGKITSYYFEKQRKRVRVSDHDLGVTVYGEPQGQNLTFNFVLGDEGPFDDNITGDHLIMAVNDDSGVIHECLARGYLPEDPEWDEIFDEVSSWWD